MQSAESFCANTELHIVSWPLAPVASQRYHRPCVQTSAPATAIEQNCRWCSETQLHMNVLPTVLPSWKLKVMNKDAWERTDKYIASLRTVWKIATSYGKLRLNWLHNSEPRSVCFIRLEVRMPLDSHSHTHTHYTQTHRVRTDVAEIRTKTMKSKNEKYWNEALPNRLYDHFVVRARQRPRDEDGEPVFIVVVPSENLVCLHCNCTHTHGFWLPRSGIFHLFLPRCLWLRTMYTQFSYINVCNVGIGSYSTAVQHICNQIQTLENRLHFHQKHTNYIATKLCNTFSVAPFLDRFALGKHEARERAFDAPITTQNSFSFIIVETCTPRHRRREGKSNVN